MGRQLIKFIGALLLFLPLGSVQGQEEEASQAYWVHEDLVKLSMVSEYEKTVKELLNLLKTHEIQSSGWITLNTYDASYSFVSPIKSMADVHQQIFMELSEKAGKEKVSEIFTRMDKCYDTELDYIIHLDKELTYMPYGITQTPEGQNFRTMHWLYVSPGNRAVVKEHMTAVKDLFTRKGSPVHYRVYRSGFGTDGEHYLVAIAAKDALHYASRSIENDELLGDEGQAVMSELFSSLLKYKQKQGEIRPDLKYAPK
ncbi:hypothetical protein HCG49_11505 [Arenibacter sp. 6A1]|uniref:hypothetical protein n=1 Tax=Arenibacter sp. 6A1 TaxID=2720391 RepID=UPI0014480A66|nr:hypothetical protein [Arenibacter sp. 6A1]NKI27189.1 hypothetical protein [Arenibacter sp. 6A1]